MSLLAQASTFASVVDDLSFRLLLICGAVFFLIAALIVGFVFTYRSSSNRSREINLKGSRLMEISWTIATAVVFITLFIWTSAPYLAAHIIPKNATEISVVGKQWMWKFQHANGVRELNELHIPVGVPILLTMTSEDVIHSLFIPEFRIKQDLLPARYTRVWFEATQVGTEYLLCSQYCGSLHSEMRGRIIVMPKKDFEQWLENPLNEPKTAAARGESLLNRFGCVSCHADHAAVAAPRLNNLYHSKVSFVDGTSTLVDEDYLRRSMIDPNAQIVLGYQALMPSYSGRLSEEDILDLIAYIKSVDGRAK